MKNERTSSTAPLLLGMAAGAALGAAGVMATNTSQRQMRRTARKLAKGAEHAVSQLDKMVDTSASGFQTTTPHCMRDRRFLLGADPQLH